MIRLSAWEDEVAGKAHLNTFYGSLYAPISSTTPAVSPLSGAHLDHL